MRVVLVHPEIPGNTGNVGRTCVATNTPLHLIKPLGFSLEDKFLKRSGLDYWPHLELYVHDSLATFKETMLREEEDVFLFSRFGTQTLWEASFTPRSILIFGCETQGLPKPLMKQYPKNVYAIPMSGPVRSLNLSTAVGVVLYEALRQTGNSSRPGGESLR